MTNIKPLNGKVLLKLDKVETTTASGLYIPESAQDKQYIGEIVSKAEDCEVPVKIGDRVMYDRYATTPIGKDGEFVLVTEADLKAVVV